jgi:phospholipase C
MGLNAVMHSPDWSSTAIFLAWDDWGGFYNRVVPPTVDVNGYCARDGRPEPSQVSAAAKAPDTDG